MTGFGRIAGRAPLDRAALIRRYVELYATANQHNARHRLAGQRTEHAQAELAAIKERLDPRAREIVDQLVRIHDEDDRADLQEHLEGLLRLDEVSTDETIDESLAGAVDPLAAQMMRRPK